MYMYTYHNSSSIYIHLAAMFQRNICSSHPVAVEDDARVCTGEVDADAASTRAQEEHEDIGVGVEEVNLLLSVIESAIIKIISLLKTWK